MKNKKKIKGFLIDYQNLLLSSIYKMKKEWNNPREQKKIFNEIEKTLKELDN